MRTYELTQEQVTAAQACLRSAQIRCEDKHYWEAARRYRSAYEALNSPLEITKG